MTVVLQATSDARWCKNFRPISDDSQPCFRCVAKSIPSGRIFHYSFNISLWLWLSMPLYSSTSKGEGDDPPHLPPPHLPTNQPTPIAPIATPQRNLKALIVRGVVLFHGCTRIYIYVHFLNAAQNVSIAPLFSILKQFSYNEIRREPYPCYSWRSLLQTMLNFWLFVQLIIGALTYTHLIGLFFSNSHKQRYLQQSRPRSLLRPLKPSTRLQLRAERRVIDNLVSNTRTNWSLGSLPTRGQFILFVVTVCSGVKTGSDQNIYICPVSNWLKVYEFTLRI